MLPLLLVFVPPNLEQRSGLACQDDFECTRPYSQRLVPVCRHVHTPMPFQYHCRRRIYIRFAWPDQYLGNQQWIGNCLAADVEGRTRCRCLESMHGQALTAKELLLMPHNIIYVFISTRTNSFSQKLPDKYRCSQGSCSCQVEADGQCPRQVKPGMYLSLQIP